MKSLLRLLSAVCALQFAPIPDVAAVTLGPDAFGYTATNAIPFAFTDISGTGTLLFGNSVDDSASSVALGFTFGFYGVGYSDVFVSSNGLMSFGGGTTQYNNQPLTVAPTQPAIAPLWDDWHTGSAGAVYYATTGAPGSRTFTVQWDDVRHYANSHSCCGTFQSVLFEGSDVVEFRYPDLDFGIPGFSFGSNATVGISAGAGGGSYLQWSHNNSVLVNGEAIRFGSAVSFAEAPAEVPAPEPSTLLLLGGGLFAARRVRSRRQ